MNDAGKKALRIVAYILGGLGIAYTVKEAIKFYKNIEKSDKETKKKLDDLGVSQEELEKIDPCDKNEFIKSLFVAAYKNPNFDIDSVRIKENMYEDFYDNYFWKNCIQAAQSISTDKRGQLRKRFIVYLSMPDITNKNIPGIGTFIPEFNDYIEQIQNKIIKNPTVWAKKELVGIIAYTEKIKNVKAVKFFEVGDEGDLFEYFRVNEKIGGLSNFYKLFKDKEKKDPKNNDYETWKEHLMDLVNEDEYYEDEKPDTEFLDFSLAYKISYNISSINFPGISWEIALKILNFLVNKLEISTDKYNLPYNHLIFHGLEENGQPELNVFYEMKNDEPNEVVYEWS